MIIPREIWNNLQPLSNLSCFNSYKTDGEGLINNIKFK